MDNAEKQVPQQEDIILTNERERLIKDIYRPDMEKFRLFTQMLRNNVLLKKASITHKDKTEISRSGECNSTTSHDNL